MPARSSDPEHDHVLAPARIAALDGVRGIAILLVLAHQFHLDGTSTSLLGKALDAAFELGWSGVHLFFVLSGFLITGILMDSRRRTTYLRTFYMRRVLRIFPLYYLLLIGAFVLAPAAAIAPAIEMRRQAWYWLYLSNWTFLGAASTAVGGLGHCWSLAVEEQFYLAWPPVVRRLGDRGLAFLCIAIASAALLARIALRVTGEHADVVYVATFCRMDALALGALGALALRQPRAVAWLGPRLGQATLGVLTALAIVAAASRGLPRLNVLTQTVGLTLMGLLFALVVLTVAIQSGPGGRLARALSFAPFRAFGKVSYAIYIFHLPLHIWVTGQLLGRLVPATDDGRHTLHMLVYFATMTAVSFGLATVSWHLIEKRVLALKRFFAPT